MTIPEKYSKYKPEFLAQGKRGRVFKFTKGKKEYVIKVKRPSSEAQDRIKNEAHYLKILNKHGIGNKLIDSSKNYLVREYAKGQMIKEFIADSDNPKPVLKEILDQCFILDKLKINKLEMHKPLKHIIVYKNKPTMIDFERCYQTEKPKNVTQFCEFINRLSKEFPKKVKEIKKKVIQDYKKKPNKTTFSKLL